MRGVVGGVAGADVAPEAEDVPLVQLDLLRELLLQVVQRSRRELHRRRRAPPERLGARPSRQPAAAAIGSGSWATPWAATGCSGRP